MKILQISLSKKLKYFLTDIYNNISSAKENIFSHIFVFIRYFILVFQL